MRHKTFSCACALACVSLWAGAVAASCAASSGGGTASVELRRARVASFADSRDALTAAGQDDKKDKEKGKDKDKDKNKSEGAGKNKGQAGGSVSADEAKALKKIQDAKDAAAKLQAAGEYAKKFPKSIKRAEVANYLAGQIHGTQDAAQRITLGESFLTVFNAPTEADIINPILIGAYVEAKRFDDAFRVGAAYLEKNPNQVEVLTRLALNGSNEASRNNLKFVPQSQQFGAKAIELIEADKKPEDMDAAAWQEYKTRWLPELYRDTGLLALHANNAAEAKLRLEKAVALKSADPFVYAVLGNIAEDEYTALAKQYQSTHSAATLTLATTQMDKVIELYARAVGLTGDKPEFLQLREQIKPGLESYYKYRHNGSMTGLPELIAKYKPAAQ
ncbi:MAG: hypothetical protein LC754_18580 [Acidobacteria bacterium]|nr:hypothetical protein [Acidobacteriota bacterium]